MCLPMSLICYLWRISRESIFGLIWLAVKKLDRCHLYSTGRFCPCVSNYSDLLPAGLQKAGMWCKDQNGGGGGGREIKSILMRKVLRGATLTRIGHAPGSPTLTSPTQTGRRYERPRPCSLPPTPGHRAGGSGPAPPPPPPPPGADAHHSAAARPPQRPGSRLETRGWGGEGAVGAGRARRRPRPPARPGVCPLL